MKIVSEDPKFALLYDKRGFYAVIDKRQKGDKFAMSESLEQSKLFSFLRRNKIAAFSVPNSAAGSGRRGKQFVKEGLTAGVPDLFIVDRPKKAGIVAAWPVAIELKRANGRMSNLSPKQVKWLRHLCSVGLMGAVCFGGDAAIWLVQQLGYTE